MQIKAGCRIHRYRTAIATVEVAMSTWSDAVSLRVLVSDDDTHEGRPLFEALVRAAHDAGLAGTNVTRGIAGYGRSGHIHERWRGFSYDLPIVVELIDTDEKIDRFLAIVQELRQGALVTRQRIDVLQSP